MAADNLSYRELVDHDELMNALREVLSNVKELYELYSPQVLDDHNTSSEAHVDIRQSIQELSAVLESYRSSTHTVNNAALTIQKNGTTVNTFTANASSNVTANITVPTKVSELTNDSDFITSSSLPTNYVTTDTNQEITGKKFFVNKAVYTKRLNLDITDLSTKGKYYSSHHDVDANEKLLKLDRCCINSDGDNCWRIQMWRFGTTSSESGEADDSTEIEDAQDHFTALKFTISQDGTSRAFRTNCTSFASYSDSVSTLGTSSLRWSAVYADSYYLGSTAFGDIVTHNASEFLTSHQSLSNYSTKANTIKSLSISGKTITCTKGDNTTNTLTTQDTTYNAGSNLSLSDTTFNVSDTPSFTSITIGGYTITID